MLDAAGYDTIVIETVGVGQDELDVAEVAESTIVVTQPGTGDDIQAAKSGILEIADVFVVNKADRAGAERAVFELEQRLDLARTVGAPSAASEAWQAPVLKCVALTDQGLPELVQALSAHRAWLASPAGAIPTLSGPIDTDGGILALAREERAAEPAFADGRDHIIFARTEAQ